MQLFGSLEGTKPLAFSLRRIGIALLLLVAIILAYAWIDGGREPLRPMSHDIAVPEAAR